MPSHVVLKAQLHRPRYAPGEVVKASVTVLCTDRPVATEKKKAGELLPFIDDLSRLEERAAPVDTRASPTAVTLIRVTAQFVGCRITDKSRIRTQGLDEDESFVRLVASPDALPAHEEPHCIFTSALAAPIQNQPLQVNQHVSASVRCTLPPSLPPTYRGQCARFYYGVYVNCVWEGGGQTNIATLRVPIRVFSPIAAITLLRAPYAVCDRPLDVRAVILPPLPTPAIAPPLSDLLLSREAFGEAVKDGHNNKDAAGGGQSAPNGTSPPDPRNPAAVNAGGGGSASTSTIGGNAPLAGSTRPIGSQFLAHALQCTMRAQSVATEYTIRHRQVPTLGLVLLSSAVSIGDTLRGLFIVIPNPEICCCRITASIESFETVPRDLFQPGSIIPNSSRKDDSGEDLVVTQSKVVEEAEFFLQHAAQMPFEFHISPLRYSQTMRVDVVTLAWCLRFRFWNCAASEVARAGTTALKLLPGNDELEVPITIYAPAAAETPRSGSAVYGV